MKDEKYILAFDTANEAIVVCVAKVQSGEMKILASFEGEAHRASNTMLIPKIQQLFNESGLAREQISAVACGRGPGSFTGVRIALATAKGIACALGVPIIGFNTLDAVAWHAWIQGIRGHIYVVADAMRREIYPALFESTETGITRLSPDKVLKAQAAADEAFEIVSKVDNLTLVGDALNKYFELFEGLKIGNKAIWTPSGKSLIFAAMQNDEQPAGFVLPVYTRLSDAEETERERLADISKKNLNSGVQEIDKITYLPMDAKFLDEMTALERDLMGSDA